MKKHPLLFSVTFLLLVLPLSSVQAVVLQYIGQDFEIITRDEVGGVSATFEFSTPLTNGAVLSLLDDVGSWSISAGGLTMTHLSATFSFGEFTIGPDLLPASWYFVAEEDFTDLVNNLPESIVSFKAPNSIETTFPEEDAIYYDDIDANSVGLSPAGGSSYSLTAGTWSVVPEPASVWLLVLGTVFLVTLPRKS